MPKAVTVTLLSKPGCHLCDEAREVIEEVRAQVADRDISVHIDEINILSDPKLTRMYAEDIPVVRINGKQHSIWHVDAERFTAAIEKASKRRLFGG